MDSPLRHITVALLLAFAAVMGAACSQGNDTPSPTAELTAPSTLTPTSVPTRTATETAEPAARPQTTKGPASLGMSAGTLAEGEFQIPAAGAFGEPGFHEVLITSHELDRGLGPTAGLRLVLTLRDAGRPAQTCSREHPLSGCATVDWSDSPGRPKVPQGGVFENRLTIRFESGEHPLFLSDSGALNEDPDPFKPG